MREIARSSDARRIVIAGSSFLFPGNAAWRPLQEIAELSFAEYGNWMQTLSPSAGAEEGNLVLVLVLEDLVSPDQSSQLGLLPTESRGTWLERHFEPLFAGLSARLERDAAHVIVLCASTSSAGSIESLKSETPVNAALSWFDRARSELQARHSHLFWVNDYQLTSDVGRQRLFDQRNWFFTSSRWSQAGLAHVAATCRDILDRVRAPRAKLLVLDGDNTIWGGVVGEDGIEGLRLGEDGYGRIFSEFQGAAKALTHKGVLVALCSKNTPEDVWRVFDEHSGMILTRHDIAAAEISWDPKSEGLKRLSEQLDIGLDSFVFWDDNAAERAEVRQECPEVFVVEPPREIWEWPNALRNLRQLQGFAVTTDDRKKQDQYKSRAKFHQDLRSSSDPHAFLRSLEMSAKLTPLDESLVSRAEQMCQKTNQFNVRTVRHRVQDLRGLSESGRVWLASLRDRYGDHGNTALLAARPVNSELWFVDTFLMSCRVLGRHFEDWALANVAKELAALGARSLLLEYRSTPRNQPAKKWLATLNLTRVDANATRHYEQQVGHPLDGELYVLDLGDLPTAPEGLFT